MVLCCGVVMMMLCYVLLLLCCGNSGICCCGAVVCCCVIVVLLCCCCVADVLLQILNSSEWFSLRIVVLHLTFGVEHFTRSLACEHFSIQCCSHYDVIRAAVAVPIMMLLLELHLLFPL